MSKNFNNFINILEGLKDDKKIDAIKVIMNKYKAQSAVDKNFYKNDAKLKHTMNVLFEQIDITDKFLELLIKIEAASAYTIFKFILDDNYSDILIHHNGIRFSKNRDGDKWDVPDHLYVIYNLFIDHFIENIKFLAEDKLDTANNTLDAEVDGIRFNLTHGTVMVSDRPVIAIRKDISSGDKASGSIIENYINSIGASDEQIENIHKYSLKGNFIIFGEVGSGKTTLLKYMGNYKLEEKNNLCTIEDTKEMFIDVPIAEVTNKHSSIKSLFINTLRQYPSHILVGETRTDDIVDILESSLTINVGTTIHATTFLKAVQRIVFMSLKRQIAPSDLLALTNAAVDCFILMEGTKIKGMWVHKDEIDPDIYKAYREIK